MVMMLALGASEESSILSFPTKYGLCSVIG